MLFISIARAELIPRFQSTSFGLELRLDLFPCIDINYLKNLLQNSKCTIMLTLRKASQGGKFQGTESEREELIEQLLELEPHLFDVEYDMRPSFIHHALKNYPKTHFVLSYHNFEKIPDHLDEIYESMQHYEVAHYKIATMTHSTNDALKMLLFVKNHPKTSVICMGERGQFARVLGKVFGNLIDYASVDCEEKTGPGQLSLAELIDIYRYPLLNKETAIYGLIGDPVEKSPGHIHHNGVFQKNHLNAVYVKMVVKPEELCEFIMLAKTLGIRGLSVTIPLKEKIVPFIDEIDPSAQHVGAINTLLFRDGIILGTNTDGRGALDAIEKKGLVHGKKVVLLGAGGAARGIAFEAKIRGADVVILNRTVQRAEALATDIGCEAGGLDEVPSIYDILINCSPDPMPIDSLSIKPETLAMDVIYSPKETVFLKEASAKNCEVVYGEEMFLNQAARQTLFWTS